MPIKDISYAINMKSLLQWWIPFSVFMALWHAYWQGNDTLSQCSSSVLCMWGWSSVRVERPDPTPKLLSMSSGFGELMTNLCILMDAITPLVRSCGGVLPWSPCEHAHATRPVQLLTRHQFMGITAPLVPTGAAAVCSRRLSQSLTCEILGRVQLVLSSACHSLQSFIFQLLGLNSKRYLAS